MRKLLLAGLAVLIVFAVMDTALAQGKGGGKGSGKGGGGGVGPGGNPGGVTPDPGAQPDPKADPPKVDPGKHGQPDGEGEVDPGVVRLVRTLRKMIHTLRMLKEKGADEKKIEDIEAKIRKLMEMLEKHDIKWREMNNHEKCNLDPEVGKLIRALEWLRNELKGLDSDKDKKKIQKIRRNIKKIMEALRKKYIGDDDLPEGLKNKEKKGDGQKEAEKGECKGDCDRERKRDGECGECDGCKEGGDCERKRDGSCDGCQGDGGQPKGDGSGGCKGDGSGGCGGKGK